MVLDFLTLSRASAPAIQKMIIVIACKC